MKLRRISSAHSAFLVILSVLLGVPPFGTVRVEAQQPARTLKGHTSSVMAVAFSPDGKFLASASRDHTVRLWNPQSGTLRQTLGLHTADVYGVEFSHEGSILATGSGDTHLERITSPSPNTPSH